MAGDRHIAETVGNIYVIVMFISLSGEEQHATIGKLIKHVFDEAIKTINMLQPQGSRQSKLLTLKQERAAAAGPMYCAIPNS